jgi:hypothetical protein
MNNFNFKFGRYQLPVYIEGKKKVGKMMVVKVRFPFGNSTWMPADDFEQKALTTLKLRKIKTIY